MIDSVITYDALVSSYCSSIDDLIGHHKQFMLRTIPEPSLLVLPCLANLLHDGRFSCIRSSYNDGAMAKGSEAARRRSCSNSCVNSASACNIGFGGLFTPGA